MVLGTQEYKFNFTDIVNYLKKDSLFGIAYSICYVSGSLVLFSIKVKNGNVLLKEIEHYSEKNDNEKLHITIIDIVNCVFYKKLYLAESIYKGFKETLCKN